MSVAEYPLDTQKKMSLLCANAHSNAMVTIVGERSKKEEGQKKGNTNSKSKASKAEQGSKAKQAKQPSKAKQQSRAEPKLN